MLGACVASFLNVVAWRVPRGESIVRPPSHCPVCNAPIKWWQNIPILGWLFLRGRCANCKMGISPRYIVVEFVGACLFLFAFWRFGLFAPFAWIWISLLVVGSCIDFDHQLLPDFVTIGGMVYGVVLSLSGFGFVDWRFSLIGLAAGFGVLWLVRFLGTKAFRREAMGMGDVFLLGAVGAIFGPVAAIFTLVVSSLIGSVAGLAMVALSKAKTGRFVAIPFGPYISAACLVWMFWGPELVCAYMKFLGF